MARGKKVCPGCNEELGVRTLTCPECGHSFRKKEKIQPKPEPVEEIEDKVEETDKVEEEVPRRRTKRIKYGGDPLHADSICACTSPMNHTRSGSVITLIGPVIVKHDLEPELVFNSMYPKIEIDAIEGALKVFRGSKEQTIPDIVYEGMIIIEELITVK